LHLQFRQRGRLVDNLACSLDHRPGSELMPLTMRPTGLGSGIDKDRQDYTVYTGGWDIGRIYEVRGGRYFLPNSCLSPSFD
jgi:hypothetical protein